MNSTDNLKRVRNRITAAGVFLGCCVLAVAFVLMVVEILRPHPHPYLGLFLYLILPVSLAGCVALALIGLWRQHRLRRRGCAAPLPTVNFGDPRVIRRICGGSVLSAALLAFAAILGYRAYHFTESVDFCGLVCHGVMKPEYTTFQDSPHSSAACVDCHIGPGVSAFVKAKIEGLHEVYLLARNKYKRPIAPPVESLRPARETCRACHWPQKFFGAVLRTWTYYRTDKANSPWSIKMLLKTGGGDPRHGPVQGFHWHMEGVNDVEYIATDNRRLEIPWVRLTRQGGKVTIFETTDKKKRLTAEQVASASKRTMDCIDCHNRPTHGFLAPTEALDMAMLAGLVDPSIPGIKAAAGGLLAGKYATEAEALSAIDSGLRAKCKGAKNLDATVAEVQRIYRRNFFPEMNVRWDSYPDHSGHKNTPGCFRCHDGQHISDSGEVIRRDCEICHVIIAQGPGTVLEELASKGLEFQHPEDIGDEWKTGRCDACHTGSP